MSNDPLRGSPVSLDQWIGMYQAEVVGEDWEQIRNAAKQLQRSTAFKRVMAVMEARVISAIVKCPEEQIDFLHRLKLQLTGLRAIRTELRVLVEETEFEKKRSEKE